MNKTANLIKAMTYNFPDEIPIQVGLLPAAWIHKGIELRQLAQEYPDFIETIPPADAIPVPDTYHHGSFTDEWGCVWSNLEEGMESIVTGHPVKTRDAIRTLKIPDNRDGRLPHGLMYLRLLDLRGFEEAMIDFAEESEELQILIDKVLTYNLIQLDVALPSMGEIVYLGDDLGIQHGLAIGAEKWRKYLKPCFRQLFQKVRQSGRYLYMHTDGCIHEIIPDLFECGASMINPQFSANGLDNLVRVCKGKIPIDLDLDRQLFPFATPSQLQSHVADCVEALYLPEGGLSLRVELNYDVPIENMAALFDALRQYRYYKG